jgi:hypothetical protein
MPAMIDMDDTLSSKEPTTISRGAKAVFEELLRPWKSGEYGSGRGEPKGDDTLVLETYRNMESIYKIIKQKTKEENDRKEKIKKKKQRLDHTAGALLGKPFGLEELDDDDDDEGHGDDDDGDDDDDDDDGGNNNDYGDNADLDNDDDDFVDVAGDDENNYDDDIAERKVKKKKTNIVSPANNKNKRKSSSTLFSNSSENLLAHLSEMILTNSNYNCKNKCISLKYLNFNMHINNSNNKSNYSYNKSNSSNSNNN